jgi:hypothetical protein
VAIAAGNAAPPSARSSSEGAARSGGSDAASLGDGVALVRRALAESQTQPRWPMYPRQFKQFLRTFQPDFDERRYGSIADLMRACQKDGILRLARDRQGVLRVFANSSTARGSLPHGWGLVVGRTPETSQEPMGDPENPDAPKPVDEPASSEPPVSEPERINEPVDEPPAEEPPAEEPPTPKRKRTSSPARARKSTASTSAAKRPRRSRQS